MVKALEGIISFLHFFFFIPSSSSEAQVIYRAAVASLLAEQQSRAEKSRARPGGGEMNVKIKATRDQNRWRECREEEESRDRVLA